MKASRSQRVTFAYVLGIEGTQSEVIARGAWD